MFAASGRWLLGSSINVTIIQVYGPATDVEEDEMQSFYARIQEEIDHIPKQDMIIIVGDWNWIVGNKAKPNVNGKFGLRIRNKAGEQLI